MALLDEAHLKPAKWVFRYLKSTMDLGLCYVKGGEETLECYVDASYGNDGGGRHSTTGRVVTIRGGCALGQSHLEEYYNITR